MKSLIIIAFLLVSTLSYGQNNTNSTLKQLVNQAIDYSSKLKEQQQNILLSESKTTLAIAQQKPTINSEIGISRIDPMAKAQFPGAMPISIQFQPNMNYNANIGGNYILFDWGKQMATIEKSKLETNLSKTNIEALKIGLAYQVANLYYSIIFTKKAITVQNEQVKLITQNGLIINNKLVQGDAIEYDKISLDVRLSNVNTTLAELQSQLTRQLIYLSALIGSEATEVMKNDEKFEPELMINLESTLAAAQKNNIELKMINQRKSLLEQEQKIINLSMKPSLNILAQVGIRNGYLPRINGENPPIDQDFRFNSIVGLKLVVPIYNGGKKDIFSQQIDIMATALKYNAEAINLGIDRDLQVAQNEYLLAKSKLELSQKNIDQAEYALKLATSRFKNGLLTSLEIEKAQTDLKDAQFVKLQYQYQITTAQLEINRISGFMFW